ncbi:MAG: alpha/beta hydrolase [Armatimonadetes bacterium]|nr:alpha/beta hydrolase [Armatimonadota bacterium]
MRIQVDRQVEIESGAARLPGMLVVPEGAHGIVVFAHGSGSGRFSPRNQFVAAVLREARLGTLLIDLLEQSESDDRSKVFDIELLAKRLISSTEWLRADDETSDLSIGYFGASTGAAAALQAAASLGDEVSAIVSRGGRPDLAAPFLSQVTAPTLLIVGGRDYPVIPLNQQAYELLVCIKEIVIIPEATHLFEEPGALEEVARLASSWFTRYLRRNDEKISQT